MHANTSGQATNQGTSNSKSGNQGNSSQKNILKDSNHDVVHCVYRKGSLTPYFWIVSFLLNSIVMFLQKVTWVEFTYVYELSFMT